MNRRFSKFALPLIFLANVSPVFAASRYQHSDLSPQQLTYQATEKYRIAGIFDDLGGAVKDSVEKEVNEIFGSEDSPTESRQREDRESQEQRQREIQENESIKSDQLTNINPASTKAKTGLAANDLTLFCDMDYAKETAEATSQSEIQNIASEARSNDCLFETEAGSELTYQYLGKEEDGIVLVGRNNNGQPYFGITQAKNIQAEEELSDSSSSDTASSSESSRENDESVDIGQLTNISFASPEMKTSYSTIDMEMYCSLDYVERMEEAGSDFNEQMSIRSEGIKNNCAIRSNAGSTLSYKYIGDIGDKENNNVLIVKNFEGKDYYAITSADYVAAEAPEYEPESGQHSMAELKQLLDKRNDETHKQWNTRVYKILYENQVTGEEYRAWKKTLSPEDIQAYDTATREKNRERGNAVNDALGEMVEDALTPTPETSGETRWCRDGAGNQFECP